MLKRFYTNAIAKKASIFLAAFVITGILMGNWYANQSDHMILASMAPVQAEPISPTKTKSFHLSRLEKAEKPLINESSEMQEASQPEAVQKVVQRDKPPSAAGFVYVQDIPMSYELQSYTYDRCKQLGLEYELVLALMWRESRFKVDAVNINTNGTQDSGIMQINDVNRSWLLKEHGISDLMDPIQNIDAGTAMLSDLIAKYGEHDALMAYQYGEQGMRKKQADGITTNDKITLLMSKREDFRTLVQQSQAA